MKTVKIRNEQLKQGDHIVMDGAIVEIEWVKFFDYDELDTSHNMIYKVKPSKLNTAFISSIYANAKYRVDRYNKVEKVVE